jgi:hypothetical protein
MSKGGSMKKFISILVLLMVLLTIGIGFAADVATQVQDVVNPFGEAVRSAVNGFVIPIFTALIMSLVAILLVYLQKKTGITLSADKQAFINTQAEVAVQMVAEKAASLMKYETIKMSSNDKLNAGAAFLVSMVPKLTPAQAENYVHAALARIPGVGATGDKALVAASEGVAACDPATTP